MKKKFLNGNILKLIAILTMLCDHTAIAIFGTQSNNIIYCIMRFIGRISFPIFIFLLSEGHKHTHSQWKYLLRLTVFYIISFVPFNLFEGNKPFYFSIHASQNIFLTLILCQLGMMLFDWVSDGNRTSILGYLAIPLIALISIKVPIFMYSWIGPMLCFSLYLFNDEDSFEWIKYVLFVLCFTGKYVYAFKHGEWLEFGVLLSLPLIYLYNGKKGEIRVNKYIYQYFFYAFYPLHLLILWAIFIK